MEKAIRSNEEIRVFLTERAVDSSVARIEVPKGCRMARPEEVALAYKKSPSFREALYNRPVWVDQTGLDSEGPHKIDDEGRFIRIAEDEYYALEDKDRSWHHPGTGPVGIGGYYYIKYKRLGVYADMGFGGDARVAYVALEKGAKASGDAAEKPQGLLRTG